MYQHYMKHIPVPAYRDSVIPFSSWLGLGRSLKQLYEQPLHYLTNVLLKRWDQQRIGSDDEHRRLDAIIHPVRAETLIWATEEVHRLTTSGEHLASLWASDPMYHACIDPVFPSIKLDQQTLQAGPFCCLFWDGCKPAQFCLLNSKLQCSNMNSK